MKTILTLLLGCLVVIPVFGQDEMHPIFENNPPHQPPAIFAASMPPCLIGVANQYGEELGVSEATLIASKAFIKEAYSKVPEFKKKVRDLELQLMKASKEERYDDYERLLRKLASVKIKASLFHEGLVKRARKKYTTEDVRILNRFIANHQNVFFGAVKLNP
ncbi:MAG: hypothetical protein AAGC45_09845 [Bacteroidota bacterium]